MYFRSCRIWAFSVFLYISETTWTNFFKISSHNLHNVYKNVWNFHWDWFTATPWNFKTKLILRTGQKSVLQHSLFWRYANFSKLMRTIHISMTSTFQCEYCQCFTFKRCDKFKLKCIQVMEVCIVRIILEKLSITSKQWML